MAARELEDYAYTFDQMRKFLAPRAGEELSPETLRSRIYRRKNIPPFIKEGGEYWFPKDLYADWIRNKPATYEVTNAS
jgi:hypothetical protein